MTDRWRISGLLGLILLFSVGCGGGSAAHSTAAKTTPAATPTSPTPTPASVPSGPFAVAVTNSGRQGVSYQIDLIDDSAHVIASATAALPHVKPNQTVSPPLVSASNDTVYFLDGDTDIRSLSPSGHTALVKSIAAGASSILAFSVSPDDQRIAVGLISQASDPTRSTSTGYVEDLADTSNHVTVWSNVGDAALRWPAGWHDGRLVDEITAQNGCGYGYGGQGTSACSYHVADASTGNRVATVCETPSHQPLTGSSYYTLDGFPTPAGVACSEDQQANGGCGNLNGSDTYTITAVDWTGREHDFFSKATNTCGGIASPVNGCNLSTDGSLMACQDSTSQAVTLLRPDGSTHSLGRKYAVLGWIDSNHLFVEVDASTLGVVLTDTGALTSIALEHADQIAMETPLPGAL